MGPSCLGGLILMVGGLSSPKPPCPRPWMLREFAKASEAEIWIRVRRRYLTSFAGLHFENEPVTNWTFRNLQCSFSNSKNH